MPKFFFDHRLDIIEKHNKGIFYITQQCWFFWFFSTKWRHHKKNVIKPLLFLLNFFLSVACNDTSLWIIHLYEVEQIIKLAFTLRLQNAKILPQLLRETIYRHRHLHCPCKNMIFTKILQKMLKILKQTDHYLKGKI